MKSDLIKKAQSVCRDAERGNKSGWYFRTFEFCGRTYHVMGQRQPQTIADLIAARKAGEL